METWRYAEVALHTLIILRVVSTQTVADEFHPIKSPDNVDCCAMSPPSVVTLARSKVDCLRQCQGQTVDRCDGVNYVRTSLQCNLFFYRPQEYNTTRASCQYLRRRSNEPCYNNPPTMYPIINPSECSFPFTSNGQLYYNCSTNSSWTNYYNCQQFYCYTAGRVLVNCLPPAEVVNYTVQVSGQTNKPTFSVFGWITFMLREYGPQDGPWSLPWVDYVNGFGFNQTYLWLGLERIHQLTASGNWRFRLEYQYSNTWVSAEYWTFTLGDSSTFYTISISGYGGDDGNILNGQSGVAVNGMKFSTLDKDNDMFSGGSCSNNYQNGGWWFNDCTVTHFTKPVPLISNGGSWPTVTESRMMMKAR